MVGSTQNLRNTKLVFSFLSGPIPFVFCGRNDHVRLPVGHKGRPGKGTGRGKVCAGSCDLESTVAVSVAASGIITRDDMVEGDFPLILNL